MVCGIFTPAVVLTWGQEIPVTVFDMVILRAATLEKSVEILNRLFAPMKTMVVNSNS